MYIGIKRWRRKEWISFVLIIAFLSLHLIAAGYPMIYWDSIRYLRGAVSFTPDPFSLTFVCYLIKPLITLMGAWGFAAFQIVLLAYVLASALKFFNQNLIVGIISIILSAAGYFAIHIMMDTYTTVGLLALFLILHGEKDILLYVILGISFIAHYENILLFPLCAGVCCMILGRKKLNFNLLPIIISLAIPIGGVILTNYFLAKDFRFFPTPKYSMVAARVMADSPEIINSYIKASPGSALAKHKEFYASALTANKPSENIYWDKEQGLAWKPGLSLELKKFIAYGFRNYKLILFKNIFKNSYRFLFRPWPYMEPIDTKTIDDYITESFPHQLKYAKSSFQYKRGMSYMSFKLFDLIYRYAVYPINLFFILLAFINRKIRESNCYHLALFSVILILANALVMPNMAMNHWRFILRIMLIPCLSVTLIIADLIKRHIADKSYSSSRGLLGKAVKKPCSWK